MFATRRSPDLLESTIEVDDGLCDLFELLEAPDLFLFRGNVNVCGAPIVNFNFSDLQQRRPVLLYIFPPLATLAKRQFWRDEFKRICIVVNLVEMVTPQRVVKYIRPSGKELLRPKSPIASSNATIHWFLL